MGRFKLFAFWFTAAAPALLSAIGATPCTKGTADCRERIAVSGGAAVPVYRSYALNRAEPAIDSAVVVVHGILRNAGEYFEWTMEAARLAGATERTLIVAPHFQTDEDKPAAGDLRWDGGNWKRGDDALSSTGASTGAVSAFDAVDRIVARLADRTKFPNLRRIVVTGHSAGGQLTSRYAVTTAADAAHPTIEFRYVIANPSTYLYLTPHRRRVGTTTQFEVPHVPECADYDEYAYGLEKPNRYVAAVDKRAIEAHARERRLTVLLGEADTETELLDMSCGAMLQGKNRFDRGVTYAAYLEQFFHPSRLRLLTVPKIGHSGGEMYQSAQGRLALFED